MEILPDACAASFQSLQHSTRLALEMEAQGEIMQMLEGVQTCDILCKLLNFYKARIAANEWDEY